MDLDNAIERIIGLAKNGRKEVYNKLSENSLIELKEYSIQEVIRSLQNFFNDLNCLYRDNQITDISGNATVYFQNIRSNGCIKKTTFIKEAEEWKIVWNLNTFLNYR